MFQENSIETCILSRVKQITSPGWMHETSARTWCSGRTWREPVEREVGGGIGMGKTCKLKAVSFQCMTNSLQIKKKKMSYLPFLLPKYPHPSKGTFLHIKFFSSVLNEDEINKFNCHIVNYVPEVTILCHLVNIQTYTCEFSSHTFNFTSNCA